MSAYNMKHPKLVLLAQIEGFRDTTDLIEANAIDSVIPAICINADCESVEGMEPDQNAGWCDQCGTNTMQSCLVLAEMI